MIKVKVKTIWNGQAGVRDKYIKEANDKMEGLEIRHKFTGEVMYIPANKIGTKIVGKSEKPVKDRFSKESHYLIYFDWKPQKVQAQLFLKSTSF